MCEFEKLLFAFLFFAACPGHLNADHGHDGVGIAVGRLVVVPDAHGDREALEAAVRLADVPLQRSGASEGNVLVVSLGDSVDRGPNPSGCYDALERVKAICLLGNHDWLNMLGVADTDDPSTPYIQEDLFAPYVSAEDLSSFGGWRQRRKAFGPDGDLGRAIRKDFDLVKLLPSPWGQQGELPPLQAAATLFMHAGLKSSFAMRYASIEAMNTEGRMALQSSLHGNDNGLLSELFHEVLQSRYLAHGKEKEICKDLEQTLAHFGAARLVVGHTPQVSRRAELRCAGRFILMDVAMSRWLVNWRQPEKESHPMALDLRYEGKSGEELLTSLQAIYPAAAHNLPPFPRNGEL